MEMYRTCPRVDSLTHPGGGYDSFINNPIINYLGQVFGYFHEKFMFYSRINVI